MKPIFSLNCQVKNIEAADDSDIVTLMFFYDKDSECLNFGEHLDTMEMRLPRGKVELRQFCRMMIMVED